MFLTEEDVNKVIRTVRGITPEDAVLTYMKQYFRDKYDICFHESSDTERKIRQQHVLLFPRIKYQ